MQFKVRLLVILLIGLFSIQPTISLSDDSLETVQLTLVITSTDEINLTAVKQVEKGINSFEAINELVAMKAKETDWGPQIMSLGGVEAIGNTYWALYVNGSMSMVGAKDVILLADTFIRLNLETF
ncbi:uncharacterized protein METZ01_LOCUS425765 [marine metagenome]|uniref:Transcobalamin-like C-terminal domain-containing protein n=1 Tax=marine metagenome TaxID=408172 RepID=A0A382XR33_9ZZZZ